MNYQNNVIPMQFQQFGYQNHANNNYHNENEYTQQMNNFNNAQQKIPASNGTQSIFQEHQQLQMQYQALEKKIKFLENENSNLKKDLSEKEGIIMGLQSLTNDLTNEKELYIFQLKEMEDELKSVNKKKTVDSIDHFGIKQGSLEQQRQISALQKFESKQNNQNQNNVGRNNPQQAQKNVRNQNQAQDQQNYYNTRSRQNNNNNNNIFQPHNINVDNMSYEQLLELESKIGKVNNGFSKDKIRNLNVIYYNSNTQNVDKTCSICMDDYRDGDEILLLNPCFHRNHKSCADKWLLQSKKCPICQIEVEVE